MPFRFILISSNIRVMEGSFRDVSKRIKELSLYFLPDYFY